MINRHRKIEIISPKMLEEIVSSRSKLDTLRVPGFIGEMFKAHEEATIENTSIQDGDNAERKKEVIENFREAWKYAEKNPIGKLNMISLTEIAGRIEPDFRLPGQSYADVRSGASARLTGGYTAPVDKSRINAHLERVIKSTESEYMHPLEEALFDYFHLIRIQPFENGNKRTANIVMNALLRENGFLPISISRSRVEEFKDYLEGAIDGFRNLDSSHAGTNYAYVHPDPKQRQFYDFLARIELCNLRCAENKLAGIKSYEIYFESTNPAAEYTLKKKISAHIRSLGLIGQVRLNEQKRRIQVTADIPYNTLAKIVSGSSGIKKYNLEIVDDASKTHYGAKETQY